MGSVRFLLSWLEKRPVPLSLAWECVRSLSFLSLGMRPVPLFLGKRPVPQADFQNEPFPFPNIAGPMMKSRIRHAVVLYSGACIRIVGMDTLPPGMTTQLVQVSYISRQVVE